MCGILGYAGQPIKEKRAELASLMEWLFKATQIRGTHASGFYSLNGDKIMYEKQAVPAFQFVRISKGWQKIKENLPDLLVAHCRYGTHGANENAVNAHPFVSKDGQMGLVHNGVLSDADMDWLEQDAVPCETPVDSERLLRFIEKALDVPTGVAGIFDRAVEGSYACVLCDSKQGKLFLWKSKGRALCYLNLRKRYGVTIFFSTPDIFRTAYMDAIGEPPSPIMMGRIRMVFSERLYSLDLGGLTTRVPIAQLRAPTVDTVSDDMDFPEILESVMKPPKEKSMPVVKKPKVYFDYKLGGFRVRK